jgi:hypothetical protein
MDPGYHSHLVSTCRKTIIDFNMHTKNYISGYAINHDTSHFGNAKGGG